MSFAPIPILVPQDNPVLKCDFLFSINILDIHVKQRTVSESTSLDFDYLKTHLITAAIILQVRSLFSVLDGAMTKCGGLITGENLHEYHSFLFYL